MKRLLVDENEVSRGEEVPVAARTAVQELLEGRISQLDIRKTRSRHWRLHAYRGSKTPLLSILRYDKQTNRSYMLVADSQPALADLVEAFLSKSPRWFRPFRWRPSARLRSAPSSLRWGLTASMTIAALVSLVAPKSALTALTVFALFLIHQLSSIATYPWARRREKLRRYRYGHKAVLFELPDFMLLATCAWIAFCNADFPYFWLVIAILSIAIAAILWAASFLNSDAPMFRGTKANRKKPRPLPSLRSLAIRFVWIAAWVWSWYGYVTLFLGKLRITSG